MSYARIALSILFLVLFIPGCAKKETACEQFSRFLERHNSVVAPLYRNLNWSYWQATSTGKKELYERYMNYQIEMKNVLSDPESFRKLKAWKKSGEIKDPLLVRQLNLIYNDFLENQIDKELRDKIVETGTKLEETFNTHRGTIEGKPYSDNELTEILRSTNDMALRKKAWEAQKTVGAEVADRLIELVKLRNAAARKLGFEDYFTMSLQLADQDKKEILGIFDELADVTEDSYGKAKAEIDAALSSRYKIKPEDMRPWHYHDFFFQRLPELGAVNLDAYFKDRDVRQIGTSFFDSMGFPVKEILERSDLYEREGKYQHAQEVSIDKKGDVRIMTNLRNDSYWMGTLLHELGHAIYDAAIDSSLPFRLREPAHTFTTEAIAQIFERVVNSPEWLKYYLGLTDEQLKPIAGTLEKNQRYEQMIFCRWSEVMVHFERELYRDPGQDLNSLWWDLVEKYQKVRRPEDRDAPDWASKIHLTTNPVYYHNYQLGQLMAAQLLHYMAENILGEGNGKNISFIGHPELGTYLNEKVFRPGSMVRWTELIRQATGEPLTSKYFAEQVVASE